MRAHPRQFHDSGSFSGRQSLLDGPNLAIVAPAESGQPPAFDRGHQQRFGCFEPTTGSTGTGLFAVRSGIAGRRHSPSPIDGIDGQQVAPARIIFAGSVRRRRLVQFLFARRSLRVLHQRSEHACGRRRDGDRIRRRLFLRGVSLGVPTWLGTHLLGLTIGGPAGAWGQQPIGGNVPIQETRSNTESADETQLRQSLQWMADLAIRKLPASFKGDKDWGATKRIWAGVDIKRDGLRLRTHRKYRQVDHGRWFRYEVFPKKLASEPGAPLNVQMTVHRVRKDEDRWTIHSTVVADANFTTQWQRWNLGLKLFSVSTRGRLQVRLDTTLSVGMTADFSGTTPAFVLDPKIVQANLVLQKFDLDRVSHVGGEVAEEIGVVVERNLKRFWLDKLNDKLAGKLNRSIAKHRDDLRWSMPNVLADWNLAP